MSQESSQATAEYDRLAKSNSSLWFYIFSMLVGGGYGLAVRILANSSSNVPRQNVFQVMTVGFILLMPFALGFISVYTVEVKRAHRVTTWICLPWLSLLAALAGTAIGLYEGAICIAMFLPIGMVLATIGGIAGGLIARSVRSRRLRNITMACILFLPFLTSPWEKHVFYSVESRRVENVVDIQASPEVVWSNIERVRAIRHDELPSSWAHAIGFPDPIEATLSHEGVGGVRNASFAGDLVFIETVDVWEPQQKLAFTITAGNIPASTLDEHVRIGGPYFDVLRGEYRLEPLGKNFTRLHLSSQHRLSTDFNWYAHLWTDAIMSDLQQRILYVVQQRCQASTVIPQG